MGTFIDVYMEQYYNILNQLPDRQRGDSFLKMFEFLCQQPNQQDGLTIIETGSLRPGGYDMPGDGQSTLLFDHFCRWHNSTRQKPFKHTELFSIDINSNTTQHAHSKTSEYTKCINDDSINFLWNFQRTPSLVYLDSADINFHNPMESSIHHLKEFACVMRLLGLPHNHQTLICVDDNWFSDQDGRIPKNIKPSDVGKGKLIKELFASIGIKATHDNYQLIYII